jgi:hypothetical protein
MQLTLKNLIRWSVVVATLVFAGCTSSDGDACDPSENDNPCISMWSGEASACMECPSSAGFQSTQGYCGSDVYATEQTCKDIYGTGTASSSGSCTSTYQGPTGDPQVSTQCMSVWNYRCQQRNTSAADQNCRVYDSLDATVSCPYCE